MQYPLEEKIGSPELLVGRGDEFKRINKWLNNIPKKLSKSRVILARRKSGKTSLVQRIFNQLWTENGRVIPFYFDIADKKIWIQELATQYYRAFVSQYISFVERKPELVKLPLSLEEILDYGVQHKIRGIIQDTTYYILNNQDGHHHGAVWEIACSAPHRYAAAYDLRFLVSFKKRSPLYKRTRTRCVVGSTTWKGCWPKGCWPWSCVPENMSVSRIISEAGRMRVN